MTSQEARSVTPASIRARQQLAIVVALILPSAVCVAAGRQRLALPSSRTEAIVRSGPAETHPVPAG